jgi:hypothetical protein
MYNPRACSLRLASHVEQVEFGQACPFHRLLPQRFDCAYHARRSKKADLSISLCGAESYAIDSASVILMDGSLKQLSQLFALAQDFETNMKMTSMGIMTPCIINLGGAFFPQFTLVHSMRLSGVLFYGWLW